jgi:Zn-dependent protease/CBS domain-containing protein
MTREAGRSGRPRSAPGSGAHAFGMQATLAIARVGGIQIRVDASWLLIFFLVFWSLSAGYFPRVSPDQGTGAYWAAGLLASLLFFVSVLVHELSHALEARRRGLEVPRITLFLFGGVSEMVREPDHARDELWIALAGPMASFGLAVGFGAVAWALPAPAPPLLHGVFEYLAWVNAALGVFNLLPGLPLDGGRVLRALVWWRTGSLRRASAIAARTGEGLAIGLMVLGGLEILGGAFVGGVWLILIGLFVRGLAGASHRGLVLRESLEGVRVADAMTRDVVQVPADLTIRSLVDDFILTRGHRAFPVQEDGRVVGLVSLQEVKGVVPVARDTVRVRERMIPVSDLPRAAPETPLQDALVHMGERGAARLLVFSGSDFEGLLTRSGIARFLEVRDALEEGSAEPGGTVHA